MSAIRKVILRSADEHVADQVLEIDKIWRQFTGDDKFALHEVEPGKWKLTCSGRTFNDIDKIDRISFDEDGDGSPVILVRGVDPIYTYPRPITPLLHQHATTPYIRFTWQPEALDVIISSKLYDDVKKLKEIILVRE